MHTVWLIAGWVVFGGIVGLIARAIFPGRQAMGWLPTVALGILGSVVGGTAGSLFFGDGRPFAVQTTGWIGSLFGALIALAVFTFVSRRAT